MRHGIPPYKSALAFCERPWALASVRGGCVLGLLLCFLLCLCWLLSWRRLTATNQLAWFGFTPADSHRCWLPWAVFRSSQHVRSIVATSVARSSVVFVVWAACRRACRSFLSVPSFVGLLFVSWLVFPGLLFLVVLLLLGLVLVFLSLACFPPVVCTVTDSTTLHRWLAL